MITKRQESVLASLEKERDEILSNSIRLEKQVDQLKAQTGWIFARETHHLRSKLLFEINETYKQLRNSIKHKPEENDKNIYMTADWLMETLPNFLDNALKYSMGQNPEVKIIIEEKPTKDSPKSEEEKETDKES